jgi:hypothetical protein
MAVLTDADRILAARQWIQRVFVELKTTASFHSGQIKAAVDAADDWADANAGSFNTALPTAFRNGATTEQKTLLLCYVILRRSGLL